MRHSVNSILAAFSICSFLAVARAEDPVPPPPSATNLWFTVGEDLKYDIHWGYLQVGESLITTRWVKHDDGRTLLRIRFESHSYGALDKIYPVQDLQESLIDPETFLPVYFLKKSRQGRHNYHEIVRFDHANRKAYWESFNKGKKKEIEIDADTRDLITTMYHLRSRAMNVGETWQMRVYTDEKIYDLVVRAPRREDVKLDRYGKVGSILFEPEASFQGLFVRKGKLYMWVSEDARRICTRMSAKIPVASVHFELAEVLGPGGDRWVKPPEESPSPPKRSGPRN